MTKLSIRRYIIGSHFQTPTCTNTRGVALIDVRQAHLVIQTVQRIKIRQDARKNCYATPSLHGSLSTNGGAQQTVVWYRRGMADGNE